MTRALPLATIGLVLLCVCVSRPVPAEEPNANAQSYATQANPETLVLDARDVGRGLMTATMQIPVKPGAFTFVYPKWVPGEHGPTGPLDNVSEIKVSASAARTLEWWRDLVDMYAFHVDVPRGVHTLDVQFTVLVNAPGDRMSTANVAIVNWNRVLFYQADTNSHKVYFKPSIILPDGWSYGTRRSIPVRSSPDSGWTSRKWRSTCWWIRRSTWAATTSTSSSGARAAPTRCSTSLPTGRRTSTSRTSWSPNTST